MGQCVEIVSLIAIPNEVADKFLGKSPWRLIGSGVTFCFPLARVRTDRPGRNPPSFHSICAQEDTSKVVPYHSPAEGFGARLELVPLVTDSRWLIVILGTRT